MNTVKVEPWGEGQGDHVVINAADFDEDVHTLCEGEELPEDPEGDEVERVVKPKRVQKSIAPAGWSQPAPAAKTAKKKS